MQTRRHMLRKMVAAAGAMLATTPLCRAATFRQYYGARWIYHPARAYYYTTYYYLPSPQATTYSYHYCIYYPAQPRYIYYYNPVTQAYWGRFEVGSTGEAQYSLLEPQDRKQDLKQIPEQAFPKPGRMPMIPGTSDEVRMDSPPDANLPAEPQADR